MIDTDKFSPRRVAYALGALTFCIVPFHTQVSCDISGKLFIASAILMILSGLLCMISPDDAKYRPFALAFVGFIVNSLCVH